MSTVEKVLLGAAGGVAALVVKFLGQDYGALQQFMHQGNEAAVALMGYAYLILAGPLLFLGGLVAYVIDEADPKKLVVAAISAPAIVTTWAGGPPAEGGSIRPAVHQIEPMDNNRNKQDSDGATLQFFAPAYAEPADSEAASEADLVTFGNAVRMFFGTAPEGLAQANAPSNIQPEEGVVEAPASEDLVTQDQIPASRVTDFEVILETMTKEQANQTAERLQEEYPDMEVRVEPVTE